jgi:hypothetical protein
MAFTAVAAIISGAEVTATLVLAAATEIGTAMTVIGAVTGNKDLMKIGGAIAMVGGVGGLINGAVSGAAGAAAEGATAGGTAESIDAAASMADAAFGGAAAGEAAQQAGISQMEAAAGQAGNVGADLATNVAAPAVQAPIQATAPTATGSGIVGSAVEAPAPTLQAPEVGAPMGPAGAQAPITPADYDVGGRFGPDNLDVGGGLNPGSAPQDSTSFFNNFSTWANKNKTLLSSGMQLAGGALKGANDGRMWDQKMQLERDRLAQTSHGSEVGIFAPRVNATPGIINGARG